MKWKVLFTLKNIYIKKIHVIIIKMSFAAIMIGTLRVDTHQENY